MVFPLQHKFPVAKDMANLGLKVLQVGYSTLRESPSDDTIKRLIRAGYSIVDIASHTGENPEFIHLEARRVFEPKVWRDVTLTYKKGRCSREDIAWLVSRYKENWKLDQMSILLRRRQSSLRKRLKELGGIVADPIIIEGPQALPPGLREKLFSERLHEVWEHFSKIDFNPRWKEVLAERSTDQWLSSINDTIPDLVKRLLGGLRPPTCDELQNLPLIVHSGDAGVFAAIFRNPSNLEEDNRRTLHVFSASDYQGFLKMRGAYKGPFPFGYMSLTEDKLECVVTLVITKIIKCPTQEDKLHLQRTMEVAKVMLALWLGIEGHSVNGWDVATMDWWFRQHLAEVRFRIPISYWIGPDRRCFGISRLLGRPSLWDCTGIV